MVFGNHGYNSNELNMVEFRESIGPISTLPYPYSLSGFGMPNFSLLNLARWSRAGYTALDQDLLMPPRRSSPDISLYILANRILPFFYNHSSNFFFEAKDIHIRTTGEFAHTSQYCAQGISFSCCTNNFFSILLKNIHSVVAS